MTDTKQGHPLDAALRARLHLSENADVQLAMVRAAIHSADAASRLFLGKPFFSLREAETVLEEVGDKTGVELVDELLTRNGGTKILRHGLTNVPTSGPVVIASTHPTGIFDFLAHANALKNNRSDIKVVANQDTQSFLGAENTVAVKFDKENRAVFARSVHTAMRAHLEGGGALLIFGSGRVPYRAGGKLVEPSWRSGATRISAECNAPVIPAALDARNSRYYYNLRKFARYFSRRNDNFGAKISSLRYASELLEKLGGSFDIHYGLAEKPGTRPDILKSKAEALVGDLYAPNVPPPD